MPLLSVAATFTLTIEQLLVVLSFVVFLTKPGRVKPLFILVHDFTMSSSFELRGLAHAGYFCTEETLMTFLFVSFY